MAGLSFRDRSALARLAIDRGWRSAVTAVSSLPLIRRRRGSPFADQLLFLPQDLRSADPSFAEELADGALGLAGQVVDLDGPSPFTPVPPSLSWQRELHSFGWLRHLEAAQTENAKSLARNFAHDWIGRHRRKAGVPWEPAVTARRIMSWLSHANLLVEDDHARRFSELSDSLGEQIVHLSSTWRQAPDGLPRLLPLVALLLCDLCVDGHDRSLPRRERALGAELDRQILADGGHVSRSPQVLIELMLDLLPLRQCFASRRRPLPAPIERAMTSMLGMLHLLRHRSGSVARFNGMGQTPADAVATIFAYDEAASAPTRLAERSRYARLAAGETTVIADVGPPPPLLHSASAEAGCLSFELGHRAHDIVVNCGFVPPANPAWHAASRSTATHSTLCLRERSSAVLVPMPPVVREIGAAALRLPSRVEAEVKTEGGVAGLTASHDGYHQDFGLVHRRRITLSADGTRVDGLDELGPPRGPLRLAHDLPFAIHFHLGTDVTSRPGAAPDRVELAIAGGKAWTMRAEGAALSIEEGLDFASPTGPRASMQIVLRGRCAGESRVTWSFERQR